MLDSRRVVKNRKIQPEAAFCPTKSLGLEWMNSNPRMQIAFFKKRLLALKKAGLSKLFRKNLLIMYHEKGYQCYHFDCDADCYPDLDISGL
ncbi:TPA: hypothetical protein MYV64_005196 [Klebsiella pneumoniae]|uniref:hypothetical protein n=1 Tax=Klebsiella quasipneumoniae TaxID=1463165 RepID=UPI003890327E|nr:hypothetical protein [Klebsiella pneumoniae]HCB3737611.1 hypothetical protein [Klebsiella pneumoniae]